MIAVERGPPYSERTNYERRMNDTLTITHDTLTHEQRAAATSKAPSIACIAGPGSGKTRTLVARCHHLMASGVVPGGLAVLTYTNAAAREIQQRIGQPIGFIGTLHSFCARLTNNTAAILSPEQEAALVAEVVKEQSYKGPAKVVQAELAGLRTMDINASTPAQCVVRAILRRLAMDDATTMDLLLVRALDAARAGRTGGFLHLLVDEFQDANAIDAAIYGALAIPQKFLVGDPDQAIYGFRGGSPEHLLSWADAPGVRVHMLEANYRSGPHICAAAQRLIEHNISRVSKRMHALSDEFDSVDVLRFVNEPAETAEVVARIRQDMGAVNRTVAVLARTNVEVDRWTQILGACGFDLATKPQVDLPEDWELLRLVVQHLAKPASEYAAYSLMRARMGTPAANTARRAVLTRQRPDALRDEAIQRAATMPVGAQALNGIPLSDESRSLFSRILGTSPEVRNWSDMALAIAIESNRMATPPLTTAPVTVSTIHGAKGREWDSVYAVGWDRATTAKPGNLEQTEEDRRLAYVAMTRARTRLVITACDRRANPYTKALEARVPSPFLTELQP